MEKDILWQLRAIAMADVTGAMEITDGQLNIRPTKDMSAELRAAIAGIEKSTGGLKLKFYDKLKALELLGKYAGLFESRGAADDQDSDLLKTIRDSTKEVIDTYDIPELQQAAATGNDMVESAEAFL